MKFLHFPVLFIASFAFMGIAQCEFYTAMAEMKKLLLTQDRIVKALNIYLIKEVENMVQTKASNSDELHRFKKVKWFYNQFMSLYKVAKKNVNEFIVNPINAYLLIKRLTADWDITKRLVAGSHNEKIIDDINNQGLRFPGEDDLAGAAQSIIRLQQIYLLETADIANGQIKDIRQSTNLTAGDCLELGRQAYDVGDLKRTIAWMQEFSRRHEKGETATQVEALEYISIAYYTLRNYKAAIEYAEKLLNLDPNHERTKANLEVYRENLEYQKSGDISEKELDPDTLLNRDNILDPPVRVAYQKLCRGEPMKTPAEMSKLHCYRTHSNSTFMLLQPLKVEVLNLEPRIVFFHDIISETEINLLKKLASPKLARATVNNSTTGRQESTSYRISKSTWLGDNEHPLIARLTDRISEITGLDTATSEDLHLHNYGIGGYYVPHHDYTLPTEKQVFPDYIGNRLATMIFYLSDVPAGGATVFPTVGAAVKPVKGSAGFWYNLYRNGEGDLETMHAACPVLIGSKWVANKWFHTGGNEFKRPCSLDPKE